MMGDRLAELLALGQKGTLTEDQATELARLMNAPIFAESASPAFVSKRRFVTCDLAPRLSKISWLSRCGEPLPDLGLSMSLVRARDWAHATACLSDDAWGDIQLEAQNQLTEWLFTHARTKYRGWNKLVDRHKEKVLKPLLKKLKKERRLGQVVLDSISWDVLSALMESSYLPSRHPCFFFLELLEVYAAGHLPCGWEGEWPQGGLIVF